VHSESILINRTWCRHTASNLAVTVSIQLCQKWWSFISLDHAWLLRPRPHPWKLSQSVGSDHNSRVQDRTNPYVLIVIKLSILGIRMSLMSDFEGLSVAHRPNLYCVGGDVKPHAQSNQGLSVNLEDYDETVDGIR